MNTKVKFMKEGLIVHLSVVQRLGMFYACIRAVIDAVLYKLFQRVRISIVIKSKIVDFMDNVNERFLFEIQLRKNIIFV